MYENMNIYKEYLYQLRKLSFVEPYLIFPCDVTSNLKSYIKHVHEVCSKDCSYHTFYGELKKIVNSFFHCWTETMDEALKEADKYTSIVDKEGLLDIMESTIGMNETQQIDFAREFLPVQSQLEQEVYREVEDSFQNFMTHLFQLRAQTEKFDKRERVEEFAKEHFPISLEKKNDMFLFTHTYISKLLTDPKIMDRLRLSIEELLMHALSNLKSVEMQYDSSLNSLLNQLYDKHKEHLTMSRQDLRSSMDIAEVQRSMEILKDKIEDSKQMPPSCEALVEEYQHWKERSLEFANIADALKKLDVAEQEILEDEEVLKEIECPFIPEAKGQCWKETALQVQENLRVVREMKANAAKALMSFLAVRGLNRIIYTDNIGAFFVDEFCHKVYFFDFGLKLFHVDCEGNFVEVDESEKCFYDEIGRYTLDSDGSKVYKIETCASAYKVKGDVMEKQTKDCGHSTQAVRGCRMAIKDPNDVNILPMTEGVDLTGDESLAPDTSEYLWSAFGHILPHALRDVASAQPKNPIHYLAHKLLFHKYSRSQRELNAMQAEAEKYRDNIFQDRKDREIAASKAWKAKQVRRRKPEESDDAAERFALDTHLARQEFIRQLNFFN